MPWSRLIDMELDDDTKLDMPAIAADGPEGPKWPYGLRICLEKEQLDKLGLDCDCDVGDVIDLRAFAVVTSVSKGESEYSGPYSRVELQIQKLAVENEMTEG